jgi:citrate lyase subunit beta / citryl-CoA lyase
VLRRSQLYVPGNNQKMIAKAATLGADSVILDLEDSVPEGSKDDARARVVRMSRQVDWGELELCVRINQKGTKHFAKDVAAVRDCRRIDCVVIPKAEGDCSQIGSRSRKKLIPVVESATGLSHLREIAASRGAVALSYGAADFAASVGGSLSAYLDNPAVKTMIVAAAAEAGIDPIDNVFFDLDDSKGFKKQAAAARALGFVGKQVVHPSQVRLVNKLFSPSRKEIEWANRVLGGMKDAKGELRGAIKIDGQLVDAVHVRLAEDIMKKAEDAGLLR